MKSRTSFFNVGVLKKDILRFAPLWGIYTVVMLLYLFLFIGTCTVPAEFAGDVESMMQAMGIINLLYGGMAAVLLYGDLFKSRLCNALHTFPLRREGWFVTHLTSGMLFCIVPNTLFALIAAVYLGQYAYLSWMWLGITVLQYVCLFGIGVFSVQLAGNALGAFTVYGITNFLPVLIAWLLVSFYDPVLYGIELDLLGEKLLQIAPAVRFAASEYVDVYCDWNRDPALTQAVLRSVDREAWLYLFLAAGAGALILGGSLLLYRKRQLERAGDFLAVNAAKPVFLLLYTLCVGALFYLMGELANTAGRYVILAVGLAVGFFTGWMLLEKRVKVFTGKRFLLYGALLAVFALTVMLTWLDPLGVTRYVPDAGDVEAVTISPYRATYYVDNNCRTLYDAADIDQIRDIHQQLVEKRTETDTDSYLTLTYKLKNGTSVTRQYGLNCNSPEGKVLGSYYSHLETVFGTQDIRELLLNTDYIEFYSHMESYPSVVFTDDHNYSGSEDPKFIYGDNYVELFIEGSIADDDRVRGLINAIEQDCLAGNMAQIWEYHGSSGAIGYLSFCLRQDRYSTTSTSITVYEDCENTVAYLKTLIG